MVGNADELDEADESFTTRFTALVAIYDKNDSTSISLPTSIGIDDKSYAFVPL